MTARDLVAALAKRAIADWTVIERVTTHVTAIDGERLARHEDRRRITLVVNHDVASGRGSARLELATEDASPAAAIDEAIDQATAAIGPAWKSVPQGAPAKVELVDATLANTELEAVAQQLGASVRAPAGVAVELTTEAWREQVAVYTRTGLVVRWAAAALRAHALVANAVGSLELLVEDRHRQRAADQLRDGIAGAARDLERLHGASGPTPGPADVILRPDALLYAGRGNSLGVWSAFTAQADALTERQGLTRYRIGTVVAPGANRIPEPLDIASDGALELGWRSAPLGDDGEPVRRFSLVEGGVCSGLALSGREAALRGSDPNGGVRNLVVGRGSWDGLPPPARTVEIHRLRDLAIDPYTGEATLDIELGIDHDRGGSRVFSGGTVRLDLIAALATARRSRASVRRGAYVGPASVWIDAAELVG